jgi:hypothetical protein
MPETHTSQASIHDRLRLIQAEYLGVPGLHLTRQQAERLWGLDPLISEALLNALVDAGFLRRTQDGRYTIIGGGE